MTVSVIPSGLGKTAQERVDNLIGVLDGYVASRGFHLNVNVLNREMLLDAMDQPAGLPAAHDPRVRLRGELRPADPRAAAGRHRPHLPHEHLGPDGSTTGQRPRQVGHGHDSAEGLHGPDVADGSRIGFVHSAETTSGVNGPGLRYTVWLSGCPLRCQYCQNPDTQGMRLGERTSASRVIREAGRYLAVHPAARRFDDHRRRAAAAGAVRGGAVRRGEAGVRAAHGAGHLRQRRAPRLRPAAGAHRPGAAGHQGGQRRPVPARHAGRGGCRTSPTSVPGCSIVGVRGVDQVRAGPRPHRRCRRHRGGRPDRRAGWAEIIDRVEVLPYHRLGVEKYTALRREYPLGDTPSPTLESVEQAVTIFRAHGLVALA